MTSWFLIEMAAKSVLICGLALAATIMLRNRAAADRASVLRIGVGLLLALPLIAVLLPALQIEAFSAPPAGEPLVLTPAQWQAMLEAAAAAPDVSVAAEPSIWDDPAPLMLIAWAAGALLLLGRLAVGLWTLRRWTRNAMPAADTVWLDALERAREASGAPDSLRLLVADGVPGPLGWGLRKPVILIDMDTYEEAAEADAILAHEVAHVARRDWLALMLGRIACALFWFNPLTWLVAREAVQQSEEAADAFAARIVEPTRYAETLLAWAKVGRGIAVPANSIAGLRSIMGRASPLARRVKAVLEPASRERTAGSRIAHAAMLACVAIATPLAAVELVEAARPERAVALVVDQDPSGTAPPAAPGAPAAPAAPRAPEVLTPPEAPEAPDAPDAPDVPDVPDAPEMAEAMAAMRETLRQVPGIVATATSQIDGAAIARAHALAARQQHLTREQRAQIAAAVAQARRAAPNAEQIRLQVQRSMPDPDVLERQIRTQVRASLAASSTGMLRGADGMERGAARMEEQARRFRDPHERERIIARERARGHHVTHDELLDAARGMEEGARGMREGAEEMRRSARRMANGS